jgi:hypothetical protein
MKRIIGCSALSLALLCLVFVHSAEAVKTRVVIRARAMDAKFIGTSIGGGIVVVRDAFTGEILSKGVLSGSTGNTKTLMSTPYVRGMRLSDVKTSKFEAVLDIKEPRKVKIEVYAPLGQPQAIASATVTTWVVPGREIVGDGIIMEIPGLIVDVLNPSAHTFMDAPASFDLETSVTPMCGCPVNPKTPWKPESYDVAVMVEKGGKLLRTVPLGFAGKTSHFKAHIDLKDKGAYKLIVYGYDPKTGNTGVDITTVIVK